MTRVINLKKENPKLSELLDAASKWESLDAKELTAEQIAILNLKRIIVQSDRIEGDNACFSCTAACG